MRRSDREVTDISEILAILNDCMVLRLGMVDENIPYIVPLNFGYSYENDVLTFYFHSAKDGRKLDVIAKNPNVCFELDCSHRLILAEKACGYDYNFRSLIGNGNAELVEDVSEKKCALSILMKHQTGKNFLLGDAEASTVTVFKVTATDFSAKMCMQM